MPYPKKNGGYCNGGRKGKGKHWNDPEGIPWWVKCECGAESTRTNANPTPVHSDWCPHDKFIKAD